jgi:hypothetical protein
MMRRTLTLLALIGMAAPSAVTAQGLAFGARAGTLGLGGEVALALSEQLVVRGGIGMSPYEPGLTLSDVRVDLDIPTIYNVGIDLYLNSAVRVGGGFLFRRSDPKVSGDFSADQDIGGTWFTPQQIGTLSGVLDFNDRAPYVLIGVGRHTAQGNGLFLDLGVVFFGEPTVGLSASDGTLSGDVDPLMSALSQEAAEFEADMPSYLKIWPIISLGVRFGAP